MLPHIHRATQKFYIFLIVYLTGCTPIGSLLGRLFLNELNRKLCYNGGVLIYLQEECYNEKTI